MLFRSLRSQEPAAPHRLEQELGQDGGHEIHRDDEFEDRNPRLGAFVKNRRQRPAENRADTLGHGRVKTLGSSIVASYSR